MNPNIREEQPQTVDQLLQALKKGPAAALPEWDELPSIPLYMDQIVLLINTYLNPGDTLSKEKIVTPAMINNYIKQKIMPPTVKKHYFRHHLACLIIICILKESVNIPDIATLLPGPMTESSMKDIYTHFLAVYRRTGEENSRFICTFFDDADTADQSSLDRVALQLALSSTFTLGAAKQILALSKAKTEKSNPARSADDPEAAHE